MKVTIGILDKYIFTETKQRKRLCRCECGTQRYVLERSLRYGGSSSCGCQKKEHSEKLQTYLTYVAGTSVDMLKSKKVSKDNTSGYKGVYLIRGKYVAKIVFQKKQYFLGSYSSIEEAAKARAAAENVLFDAVAEHYRNGKKLLTPIRNGRKRTPFM